MTMVEVWKSLVAHTNALSHLITATCKGKCYISERNRCGKVMDVISFLGNLFVTIVTNLKSSMQGIAIFAG
jgi:hypothetical protein